METSAISATRQSVDPPPTQAGQPALSSDFQTFLVMLTTQMENQDPLNPIESSDFAVQLATFSGVEQQVRTNDLLAAMAGGAAMADLASWVGLDARIGGPVDFDGAPVRIDTGADRPGQERRLIVRSATGEIVASQTLPREAGVVEWAGLGEGGRPLPQGPYDLTVEYTVAGDVVSRREVDSYSRILEARRTGVGTELVLENGRVVPADDVAALRAGRT